MTSGYELVANSLSSIPTDWIVIVSFAILIAFDAVRSGTSRACALALSLPVTLFLISELPHAKVLSGIIGQFATPTLKAVLFGIIFVVAYILVRRMNASYRNNSGASIQAVIAGIATVAVVVVVWLQVPELQSIWHFGAQVQSVFGEAYRFWWVVGAFVALAFVES